MRPIANLVKDELSPEELGLVPKSYDIIGSEAKAVAVVEIPDGISDKKEIIARSIMKINKNVKSVLNKKSGRKGTHRLEDLELIIGEDNTEVTHKEHGYILKLDPRKVFFSPREATERQRIASQVKPNENVCVFFSGICPYSISICKKQPLVNKVYAIEINPDAHKYAVDNIRMNKLSHKIIPINGDVRNVSKEFKIKFDRVIMPMAVDAENYLDEAFDIVKDGGMIHFYSNGKEEDMFSNAKKLVNNVAKKKGKKMVFENMVKVLPFSVRSFKISLDIKEGVP